MIGTMERLLGVPPMSIFDQRATPMWPAFGATPNLRPYDSIEPTIVPFGDPGFPRDPPQGPFASWSKAQDFSVADGPCEQILNQAIWDSIRGTPHELGRRTCERQSHHRPAHGQHRP
jgi:hypothetical protein